MKLTPIQPKKQRLQIQFYLGTCHLAEVLVASSQIGICALFLGHDPKNLIQDLANRFNQADLIPIKRPSSEWLAKALQAIQKPQKPIQIPLHLIGTPFQIRVWQTLRKIPFAQTTTYREIALQLGKPQSARAVGRACASNPISVLVPCHRVLRADSKLGGYRWGIQIKNQLLKLEQANS